MKPALLLPMLLLAAPAAGAAEVLRAAINTSWGMPFAQFDGERIRGVLMFDLLAAIGDAASATVVHVPLPRKRVEGAVLAGEIDLRCYVNPKWTDAPDAYVWSEPIFELSDVLFASGCTAPARQLDEIPLGSVVSAVLGYRYPTLDRQFADGLLKREDTIDQDKVLLKVSAGRTAYGLSNAVTLDWYRRTTPRHQLADWRLVVATTPIHCAIPKSSPWDARRLTAAIVQIKRTGRVEQLLSNYR